MKKLNYIAIVIILIIPCKHKLNPAFKKYEQVPDFYVNTNPQ